MSTGITLTQAPPQSPRDESRYSRSTEDEKGELSPGPQALDIPEAKSEDESE